MIRADAGVALGIVLIALMVHDGIAKRQSFLRKSSKFAPAI